MGEDKRYNIDIYGLKIGIHEYRISFDKLLFEKVEDGLIETGTGECLLTIERKETLLTFHFEISGSIELTCDRSMEKFDHPIKITESLIVKYGDEYDDSNDDILIIPNGQQTINIEKNIYEYVSMAVPMKKLHPKYGTDSEEGFEWVYSSDELTKESDSQIEAKNYMVCATTGESHLRHRAYWHEGKLYYKGNVVMEKEVLV